LKRKHVVGSLISAAWFIVFYRACKVHNLCDSVQIFFKKPLVISTVTIGTFYGTLLNAIPFISLSEVQNLLFRFYDPACPAAIRVNYIHKILPILYNKCEVTTERLLHGYVKFGFQYTDFHRGPKCRRHCVDISYSEFQPSRSRKVKRRRRKLFTPRNKLCYHCYIDILLSVSDMNE
jgi:hypothetical protein